MDVPRGVADLHARFCGALTHRYFIRAHMSAMLALVVLTGTLGSRLLLRAGVSSMALRYPFAVLLSYLVFFGLVRLWLAYVCRATAAQRRRSESSSDGDLLDGWGGGSGGSGSGGGRLFGGGGASGGGGSSGGWADAEVAGARPAVPLPMGAQAQAGTGGGGGGGSPVSRFFSGKSGGGGGGGDGDGLLLLILFALLVVAIFGAGAYLIVQAPAILSEAAFQAVLAGGLVRTARGAHDPGWAGSVLRATAIPFVIVLVLAGAFGYESHKHCPTARTAREVMRTCVFH